MPIPLRDNVGNLASEGGVVQEGAEAAEECNRCFSPLAGIQPGTGHEWYGWRDSNPRPSVPKTDALIH